MNFKRELRYFTEDERSEIERSIPQIERYWVSHVKSLGGREYLAAGSGSFRGQDGTMYYWWALPTGEYSSPNHMVTAVLPCGAVPVIVQHDFQEATK